MLGKRKGRKEILGHTSSSHHRVKASARVQLQPMSKALICFREISPPHVSPSSCILHHGNKTAFTRHQSLSLGHPSLQNYEK